MKYIRTKDGRIVEESKLEPGLKQTCITLIRKRDNKTLTQIICDDMDDYVEMIAVGEYCKYHKINPKEIRYERTVLLNEILKQSNTIEELCDAFVLKTKEEIDDIYRKITKSDLGLEMRDKYGVPRRSVNWFYLNDPFEIYGAIWTDKGLIYVAKMNDKGELELL